MKKKFNPFSESQERLKKKSIKLRHYNKIEVKD